MHLSEDEQDTLDREDVEVRLRRLVDAIAAEHAASETVRSARDALRRAEAALKTASMRVVELSFIERRKRRS